MLSRVRLFVTPWTAARQASLSITNSQTHIHWVGDAIQSSHPLSSPSPPALNLSEHQGLLKWVSSSHHVAKGFSFSFNISPSNEHSGLMSFRMDWLDLLAVQGTLKSLLQHNSSKVSILQCPAFFAEVFLELIDKNYYVPHFLCSMKCHWTWNHNGYWHFQLFKDIGFSRVQWLAFCTFAAKGLGSSPCRGTLIPQATQCNQQINK